MNHVDGSVWFENKMMVQASFMFFLKFVLKFLECIILQDSPSELYFSLNHNKNLLHQ
jgi:hypothetical protein